MKIRLINNEAHLYPLGEQNVSSSSSSFDLNFPHRMSRQTRPVISMYNYESNYFLIVSTSYTIAKNSVCEQHFVQFINLEL